jgi:hypothetical protein
LPLFTLKFWNTWPTHLIWPLQTNSSFLTSINSSRKRSLLALRRPHSCGWVVLSTTKINCSWMGYRSQNNEVISV